MNKKEKEFIDTVINFYKTQKRDLPWRHTNNPYHIVVSEIMLQQTQVPRVVDKYLAFIDRFPSWKSLTKASFPEILTMWNGLGYNRRAKYLQMIAQKVITEWNGVIPDDPNTLVTFPGIGKATAASIVVYAFNKPIPFIETNIRRVFIHHFFDHSTSVHDKEIMPLVEKTLDISNPKVWYWALMDYGTHLATKVENPNRKSKHYAKQSRFEGSVRKIRGEILRQLLIYKTLDEKKLYKIDGNHVKVKSAIESLVADKLVIQRDGIYSVSN